MCPVYSVNYVIGLYPHPTLSQGERASERLMSQVVIAVKTVSPGGMILAPG
jgi:hypothetical protein